MPSFSRHRQRNNWEYRYGSVKKNTQGEPLIFIKGRNDLKKDKNIRKLIASVRKSYIYKRFANIDNLKTQILNSLISYLDERGKLNKLPFDETLSREADYNARRCCKMLILKIRTVKNLTKSRIYFCKNCKMGYFATAPCNKRKGGKRFSN